MFLSEKEKSGTTPVLVVKDDSIESCVFDKRDNILTIEVAMANSNKQEESDDKPDERRNTA